MLKNTLLLMSNVQKEKLPFWKKKCSKTKVKTQVMNKLASAKKNL